MNSLPNTPGFMDGITGAPGNTLYSQMQNDLGPTPNTLYNQSEDKKAGVSFKQWLEKQKQPGGVLNQAGKKYGAMFDQWLVGKLNLAPATEQPAPSTERGTEGSGSPRPKAPMSMALKIAIGVGIALAVSGAIAGIIYYSKTKNK